MVPYILGLNQGLYRVVPDGAGGSIVTPPPMLPAAQTTRIVRGDPGRRLLPLADFEQQVRTLAGGGR